MRKAFIALVVVGTAFMAGASHAPEQTNMNIVAFVDHNENLQYDGEEFIDSEGTIEINGRTSNWEGNPVAQVTVPYGSHFTVRGRVPGDLGLYTCTPVSNIMPDSGIAFVYIPCDPKNWFEMANHLWVSFILWQEP